MTTPELFPASESQPPELDRARARLERAQADYDAAQDVPSDVFGEAAYAEVVSELRLARRQLSAAEWRALQRSKA